MTEIGSPSPKVFTGKKFFEIDKLLDLDLPFFSPRIPKGISLLDDTP